MKRPFAVFGFSLLISAMIIFQTSRAVCIFCAAVLICGCVAAVLLKKRRALYILFAVFTAFSLALLCVNYTTVCRFDPLKALEGQNCRVCGAASDFCEAYTAEYNFVTLKNCRVNGVELNADIRVIFPQSFSCSYSDEISADVFIYSNDSDSPADFSDGVFLTAAAKGAFTVQQGKRHSLVYYAKHARLKLARLIDSNMQASDAAIVKALLLGDKSSLSDEFVSGLKICGASHIFAVSGMHLSLWTGIIFMLLRSRSRTKLLPNIGVSLFVLFYMALTGFSASVLRSGIMLITVFAGFCFRRPADAINSLGLSAVILLLAQPLTAVNVSFLLSFGATASILLLYPYIERHSAEKRGRGRFSPAVLLTGLLNSVLMSLGVLLITAPISGEYFGTVSLLSPVSSLLCTLPAEGLMLSAAAGVCLSKTVLPGAFFFRVSAFFASLIYKAVEFLSQFDFAVCHTEPEPLLLWYAFSAAVCLTVWYFGGKRAVKTITSLLVCAGLMLPAAILKNLTDIKNTYLYLPNAGVCGTALIHGGPGAISALIYCGENENSVYSVKKYAGKNNIAAIDTLIMPAGNAENLTAAQKTGKELEVTEVCGADYSSPESSFLCRFKEGTGYENHSGSGTGVFFCGCIKTVFCFFAGATPEQGFPAGDILICRAQIPGNLNTALYEKIIVLSDKSAAALGLPENAVSTADTGGITIKYEDGGNSYVIY